MKVLDAKIPKLTAISSAETLFPSSVVSILVSIAGNENVSKTDLQRLAKHYNPEVRAAVIENRNVPFKILAELSDDEHPDVRYAMAENSHVPKLLLQKLAMDDNPYVASRACTTLKRLNVAL